MIQKLKILGIALVTAAGLASCGGEGGDPLDDTSTLAVLNTLVANGGLFTSLPTSNNPPPLPIQGVSPASSGPVVSVTGCENTTSSGDTPDNDGIDTLKTYTFDCSGVVDSGNSYTQKGTVIFKDLDVNVAGVEGGMRADMDVPVFSATDLSTGTKYESSYKGFFEYKKDGTSIVSNSEFTGTNKYAYNIGVNDYSYTSGWLWKLTPDDPNNIWTSTGKIEIKGTFLLSGKFISEVNGTPSQGEGSFFVNYYTENLTYDDNCGGGSWYKNGSLIIEDANATKIEVRYVNCTGKLYINGLESDLWTP